MNPLNPGDSPANLLSNRYQILGVLGDGGFGRTYLVVDTQMPSGRKCVLKQLKPIHDNPQIHQIVRERFQREAAILEQLGEHHTQIPRLYAYFSHGEEFYLVEEWVEGETLTQRVQQYGIFSETEVRSLLSHLLPTIGDIHRQGIIHRDIKPDNIILRRSDSKPVLIDFGAVKETMSTVINSQGNSTRSIVVGTPGYMPSEQLAGRPVFSSDLYSLGLTAIYLLTGRQPQQLDSDPMTGEVLWRQYAPNVSPEFAAILDRSIRTYANQRFMSAQDMALALESGVIMSPSSTILPSSLGADQPAATIQVAPAHSFQKTPSIPTAYPQRSSWTWQWALVGVGIASLAGVFGVFAVRMLQPNPTPPQPMAALPVPNSLASDTPTSKPSTAAQPSVKKKVPSKVSPAPESEPKQSSSPKSSNLSASACNYSAGTAAGGQALKLDLCSLNTTNAGAIQFVYYLDSTRIESEADCSKGTWTTFPEQQVNRPKSQATQKMLDRVCAQKTSPNSVSKAGVATVIKPPSNVRVSPNGAILCSVKEKRDINVYDLKGDWYTTDVCGTIGVIHSSQLKF